MFFLNKNYQLVRNTGCARSRYTLKICLKSIIYQLMKRVYLERLTVKDTGKIVNLYEQMGKTLYMYILNFLFLFYKYSKYFVFQAALSLRESYILKAPNSKLSGKDKAAIVAKELGDFLGHYKRETELYTVFREESGMVPRHIFEEFIAFASDSG